MPDTCKFYIEGDAPDASLVDTSQITTPANQAESLREDATNEVEASRS